MNKRDIGYMRDLLQLIEGEQDYACNLVEFEKTNGFEDNDEYDKQLFHIRILEEIDFVEVEYCMGSFVVERITNDGYNFLDATRDKSTWESLLAKIKSSKSLIFPKFIDVVINEGPEIAKGLFG